MQKAELNKYKKMLESKQADLTRGLRNRDDITIEKTADLLEEVQLTAERELAIRNLHRESGLLRDVRLALSRIKDGTYGVCMNCEEEIKPKRLEAVPWAGYCVRCQEMVDRREISTARAEQAFAVEEAA